MRNSHLDDSDSAAPILDGTTSSFQPAWEMPPTRAMPKLRPRNARRSPARPELRFQAIALGLVIVALLATGVVWAVNAENHSRSAVAAIAADQASAVAHKAALAKSASASKKKGKSAASKASSASTKTAGKTSTASAKAQASAKASSASKIAPAGVGSSAAAALGSAASGSVVVIDAGHQGHGDSSLEPIGPGSTQKKPKVADGASGARAPRAESEINLEVALKLRSELQTRGIKVIMVRTSQNVNIANSQRAAIANKAHAALFVRLHCDGVSDSSVHGFSTLIPAKNQWTGPILSASAKAGRIVQTAALKATGAADRGVVNRGDLSGFNWSKVPTILVEMGFMSNAAEDRALTTAAYQHKLATGLANGVASYLKSR